LRVFRIKPIVEGNVEGEIVLSRTPISFLGDVDPNTGLIIADDSDVKGIKITDKILIIPRGRGSTVGSYILYALRKRGLAPKAIIMVHPDPVIIAGCVIADIPLALGLSLNYFNIIKTGDYGYLDGVREVLVVEERDIDSH